ncbi:MAG: peptide chain release factor 1 [Elusimicrobia bacterium CG08_land_8_20_14_0_20_44_26]|nr:MAG: peptide chain release factor 1 [Elusimicrobia bacterium CG08_land_8_20_14_0_20_44_26]
MEEKYLKILRDFKCHEKSLAESGVFNKDIHQKYKALKPFYILARELQKIDQELNEIKELKEDVEMRALYEEEASALKAKYEEVRRLLDEALSKSPFEGRPIMVEIRAGTGGKEAGLFAADLFKMYQKLAESVPLKIEVFSIHPIEIGGIKEVVFEASGDKAYFFFRFEGGVHRVQRVPLTEASGRIHTSSASVAVYPEPDEVEVNINPADLKIDTYRSSGKGGQHVNKTDSAVRITHTPTGIVASCQEERSQNQNKRKAMKMLQAKIYDKKQQIAREDRASVVRSQVGSAARSEKIRTYNFSQNRVTDHRIKFTLYNLEEFMEGKIEQMTQKLWEKLASTADF